MDMDKSKSTREREKKNERYRNRQKAHEEIFGRGASSPVVEGGVVQDLADGHP